jgi:hypothetical protein
MSLNQDPGRLALSQSDLRATNHNDERVPERGGAHQGDRFTWGEAEVEETPAIRVGTVQFLDPVPPGNECFGQFHGGLATMGVTISNSNSLERNK